MTDADGRCGTLISDPDSFEAGTYRIEFGVEEYYTSRGEQGFYPSVQASPMLTIPNPSSLASQYALNPLLCRLRLPSAMLPSTITSRCSCLPTATLPTAGADQVKSRVGFNVSLGDNL